MTQDWIRVRGLTFLEHFMPLFLEFLLPYFMVPNKIFLKIKLEKVK